MSILLLGVTLLLYGIQLIDAFLPNEVLAVLFIITGIFLVIDNRPHRV